MNALEIILLPFTFIYKGFITVLLLPYYFIVGIGKVFGIDGKKSKKISVVSEKKNGEQVKVVKNVKSAFDTPVVPKPETDINKINEKKQKDKLKRQKEFEKLFAKERDEESKRIKEQ